MLKQSVASGKEAKVGSKIVLTVQDGGPQVAQVPNLVSLTYAVMAGEKAGTKQVTNSAAWRKSRVKPCPRCYR